jgi:hypothetical protein
VNQFDTSKSKYGVGSARRAGSGSLYGNFSENWYAPEFTWSVWMLDPVGPQFDFIDSNNTGSTRITLELTGIGFRVRIGTTDGTTNVLFNETRVTGTWEHAAFTVNNTTIKVYYNGILTNTAALPIPIPTTPRVFFRLLAAVGGGFGDGNLDELRLYDRVLTDTQIFALYSLVDSSTTVNALTSESDLTFTFPLQSVLPPDVQKFRLYTHINSQPANYVVNQAVRAMVDTSSGADCWAQSGPESVLGTVM